MAVASDSGLAVFGVEHCADRRADAYRCRYHRRGLDGQCLKRELAEANERIAELNNDTARLYASGRDTALAAQAIGATAEQLALAQGLVAPETLSEVARPFQIAVKLKPFAGTKFDAVVTSSGLRIAGVLRSLSASLAGAGWIEVDRSAPKAIGELSSADGPTLIRIDVDAKKGTALFDAAEALAATLNGVRIAAVVSPTHAIDASGVDVIHIVIGPKP